MARDHRAGNGPAEVPELAWLRRLVTGLALVMGLGVAAVAAILWVRLSQPPLPELPPGLALPDAGIEPLYLRRPDATEPGRRKSVLVRPSSRSTGARR